MLIHLALFRWKKGTSEKKIKEALQKVKSLCKKCKGVKAIYCGKNFHSEAKGFTHGVVVLADNQEALDAYRQHPDHKDVAQEISAMEEDGLGFDFED